eukprot:g32065.t1
MLQLRLTSSSQRRQDDSESETSFRRTLKARRLSSRMVLPEPDASLKEDHESLSRPGDSGTFIWRVLRLDAINLTL